MTRLVVIESPYGGNVELSLRYLRACMAAALERGEAPFASHGLYTQPGVLCDNVPAERDRGIAAGFAWRTVAEATIVYTDLGISNGMRLGIDHAESMSNPVEYRTLGWPWNDDGISIDYKLNATDDLQTSRWGETDVRRAVVR
jgi:hypothetical protein